MTAARFTGEKRSGIHRFLGIRYARARRFMPPVAEPFRSQARADAFGPSCSQSNSRSAQQDEDCLFLNVWIPGLDSRAMRPVMVYIHGNDGAKVARYFAGIG